MNPEGKYKPLTIQKNVLDMIDEYFRYENASGCDGRATAFNEIVKFLVKTGDGSYTLKSELEETMHTHHGGLDESLEKYVLPSKLHEKDDLNVLDVCSGLGYTAAVLLDHLNDETRITLDMVEISALTLATTLIIPSPLKSHGIIKKSIEDELYKHGFIKNRFVEVEVPENIRINVHVDDIRNFVSDRSENYDAIFLIPFSPKISPELYTLELLKNLGSMLKIDGILSTFTASIPVRSALIEAGLHVGEGPKFGRSGGTLASPSSNRLDKTLSFEQERMIALTDAGIPYRDPDHNGIREEIVQNRRNERLETRKTSKFGSTVQSPFYLCKDLPEGRLKRRVLKDIKRLGFNGLNTESSRYLVCPQYSECICGKGCSNYHTSRDRVLEMEKRLNKIIDPS